MIVSKFLARNDNVLQMRDAVPKKECKGTYRTDEKKCSQTGCVIDQITFTACLMQTWEASECKELTIKRHEGILS